MKEKKKSLPRAQTMPNMLFGPILVVTAFPNPPCPFQTEVEPK